MDPRENPRTEVDRNHDVRGMYDDPRFADEALAKAPMKEVPGSLSRLTASRERLHETVKVLHERLQPIMSQTPRNTEAEHAVPGYGAPIATAISTEADQIDTATEVLMKILNEIEV